MYKMKMAIKPPIKASKIDSPINWTTRDRFCAPTHLRIPTSFALFSLRAVVRFIKLIQAMRRMNAAMIAKSLTNSISPPSSLPFVKFEYKRQRLMGYKNISHFGSSSLSYFTLVPFIFELADANEAFCFSNTYVRVELLPQVLSSSPLLLKYCQGSKYSNLNLVLLGRSLRMPVTVKLSLLSILITLPIALSSAKSFFANVSVRRIGDPLFKAVFGSPFNKGKLKTWRKPVSTIFPVTVNLFSPTENRKLLGQFTRTARSTSGTSFSVVRARILGVVFQHCSLPLKTALFHAS